MLAIWLVRCIHEERVVAEAIDTHTHFVPSDIPQEPGRNPLWPSIEQAAVTVLP